MKQGKVYLIPTVLEENALETIPTYIVEAIKNCSVFLCSVNLLMNNWQFCSNACRGLIVMLAIFLA